MPLVLVAVLAAPLGIALLVNRMRPPITTPQAATPGLTEGAPGIGDPYFPDAGSGGYDVVRYQIFVNWDVSTQSMR